MVESQHFGRYACVYHDPMPKINIILPVFEESKFWEKQAFSPPKSDHSECGCKPNENTLDLTTENIRECFAEFELRDRAPKQSIVDVSTDWSKLYVAIPLGKAYIHLFTTLSVQFEAINGPQLKRLRNRTKIWGDRGGHDDVKNDPVYDIFLSYCNEDAYDRAVAHHFKAIAIDIGLTVFDPHEDILAGQIVFTATSAAIHRSSRFVIIFSDAYKQDSMSSMEFGAVNDTIISQNTNAESRLLVFRVGSCVIDGLHQLPCIPIPDRARGTYSLDESCQINFREWEGATRPDNTKAPAPYTFFEWLGYCGFNWKSVVFILTLFVLSWHSTIFNTEE
ncbi:hypothetical protein PoB_002875200 [Plakobranchus ocellatus]|uniref:TIR domain-containing protein n=1 Tax=Plakobranchus ocellatus TaxID=259542 RepID=A0AAV4A5V8_9GAST|nr:hypothetical protein PoB_002875200 [Plakobranchus ocellatus]